jgi:hypothetical protein
MAVPRISPREARQKAQRGEALLVCAYDSLEKFSQFHLEDAWSLDAVKARGADLPKARDIILSCA